VRSWISTTAGIKQAIQLPPPCQPTVNHFCAEIKILTSQVGEMCGAELDVSRLQRMDERHVVWRVALLANFLTTAVMNILENRVRETLDTVDRRCKAGIEVCWSMVIYSDKAQSPSPLCLAVNRSAALRSAISILKVGFQCSSKNTAYESSSHTLRAVPLRGGRRRE
jgi:hypothetical protein